MIRKGGRGRNPPPVPLLSVQTVPYSPWTAGRILDNGRGLVCAPVDIPAPATLNHNAGRGGIANRFAVPTRGATTAPGLSYRFIYNTDLSTIPNHLQYPIIYPCSLQGTIHRVLIGY